MTTKAFLTEMALDLAETLGEQRLLSDSLFGYADCLHRGQRYADATVNLEPLH